MTESFYQLNEIVGIQWIKTYQSAATSAVTSDTVNMAPGNGQAFDGVLLIARFGTAASNNTVNAQQSSDDGSTDAYSDIAGTSVVSGSSDECVWIDILKPTKQYIQMEAARGTSSTLESMVALKYRARMEPVDNTVSGTITGEAHVSPDEGTA